MLLGALLALALPLHGRPDDDGYVPDCGSAIRPILPPGPAVAPIYSEDCARQQDDRRQLAIPFIILGLVVGVGVAIARPAPELAPVTDELA